MRNIALRLAYDGTHFAGSQWQRNGRSVQGELETAWSQLTQEQHRFIFSGRTDAGVHAQGQVANIRTETVHTLVTLQRALNALLPHDIAVLEVWEAASNFHARYSAQWRWYRYLMDPALVTLPMLRHYVVHVPYPLDVAAMQAALVVLHGEHDFAAFAGASHHQGSTIRWCERALCTHIEMFGRPLIAVDLVASGFLRHMVRTLVGTLLLVGRGQLTPEGFEQVLNGRNRQQAGPTAAAHGLTLMAVGYPEDRV